MNGIAIVDPHMHLWDLQQIRYPWLTPPLPVGITGDVGPIAKTYLPADYHADHQGWTVTRNVHVEAGADPRDALAETEFLHALDEAPDAIVAYADLGDVAAERLLAEHRRIDRVCGVRQILNWHADPKKTYTKRDLLADPNWRSGFALLRKYELSFDLQIYPSQMQDAAALAARHPDTQIVLNHTGMPVDRDAESIALWRDGMAKLAAQPNVAVKISGLAMLDWRWTVESLRPFVLDTIDRFGTGRAMFASNFPVDRLFGGFSDFFGAYHTIVSGFSADEQRALFADNAARIYRLRESA
jgi:predicted TIM-barrel fold metal-dependent hydrolase